MKPIKVKHSSQTNLKTSNQSAYRLLFILTVSIFITEFFTMSFLNSLFNVPNTTVDLIDTFILVDSFILIVVLFPILYLLVFRPFKQKVIEVEKARKETLTVLSELDQVYNTTASAMRVIDVNYNIIKANQAFLKLVNLKREEIIGKKCYEILCGPSCKTANCTMTKVLQSNQRVELETNKERRDGKIFNCIVTGSPFISSDGEIIGIVEDFQNMTKYIKTKETLKYKATHDHLTGLSNRMSFNYHLSKAIKEAHHTKEKLCVMFLDLDKFKQINDTFGHIVGDKLLVNVANRVKSCVRKGDTVARLGGDEITLILPSISLQEDALKIAKKIVHKLEEPHVIEEHDINVKASIGIAIFPDDAKDAKSLLIHADLAMYQAKETGNTFVAYSKNNKKSAKL